MKDKKEKKSALSKEHMKEYSHMSAGKLKKHMTEEKELLKKKKKK